MLFLKYALIEQFLFQNTPIVISVKGKTSAKT